MSRSATDAAVGSRAAADRSNESMATHRHAEEARRFAEVLEEHGGALGRAVASYERDPALQEDLYQDVCLALWRALRRFRGDASVRTFALRIAHNRGVSHVVRQIRRGTVDEPMAPEQEAELVAPERGPEGDALERERTERLRRALRTLPLGLRQAVTLRLEGLAHREIAEVLGISENAVAIRLSRARSRLEASEESREVAPRDGEGDAAATGKPVESSGPGSGEPGRREPNEREPSKE